MNTSLRIAHTCVLVVLLATLILAMWLAYVAYMRISIGLDARVYLGSLIPSMGVAVLMAVCDYVLRKNGL